MSDVPKDPRQLARDILAGKISIEDLAREQARRRGGVAPAAPRPMNLPAAAQPVKMTSPPIRAIPSVRSAQPLPPPVRRTAPLPPVRRDPVREIRPSVTPTAGRTRPATASVGSKPAGQPPAQPVRIASMLREPGSLRRAIVLSEILGPPVAFREPK